MHYPTIHLNGSSAERLAESYQNAASELASALRALESVELNARDYYPQGAVAFKHAAYEHTQRCRAVQSIVNEMQAIADHCWAKTN